MTIGQEAPAIGEARQNGRRPTPRLTAGTGVSVWGGFLGSASFGSQALPLLQSRLVCPLSDPVETDIGNRLIAPSARFWLGTDQLGRDLLARVIYGARVSLTVAFGTVVIGAVFGMLLGLPAGYFRGRPSRR